MTQRHTCLCCGHLTLTSAPPGTRELCPVCGWEDSITDRYWDRGNAVDLCTAQSNFSAFGAAEHHLLDVVRPPTEEETRPPNHESFSDRVRRLGREWSERALVSFRDAKRPREFTDRDHCIECAEHDDYMQHRIPSSIAHTTLNHDVFDRGMSPLSFLTPAAVRCCMPALVRLACADDESGFIKRPGRINQLAWHVRHWAEAQPFVDEHAAFLRAFFESIIAGEWTPPLDETTDWADVRAALAALPT